MSNFQGLLDKIENGSGSWDDYTKLMKMSQKDFIIYFDLARKITVKNFDNILKIYTPSKKFPAISITGNDCALACEHCNKKYLDGMHPILTNDELKKFLINLSNNDGIGALISGGCNQDGSVPLYTFLDTIKEIKDQTNLIVNVHTGLVEEKTVKKLAEAKVDIISFDVNMDEEILRNIYHLNRNLEDYEKAIINLKKYNLNVVPHLCIGLYYGELHEELTSLKFMKEYLKDPSLIVVIVLIPPKNGIMKFKRPKAFDIAKTIAIMRFLFPTTEISLGCMRPRDDIRVDIEKMAFKAGINRIEIPSIKTLKWIKKFTPDISFKFFSACCAIPEKFEGQAKSSESEIKRYLTF